MTDFSKLRNFSKRRYYQYVLKEKERLIKSGVDVEYLRLYCRSLSKQHCEHAERRFEDYRKANYYVFFIDSR